MSEHFKRLEENIYIHMYVEEVIKRVQTEEKIKYSK